MSEPCGSISGSPLVIHSATVLAIPGASLIQIAATDQRPLTSGVSPMIGLPSGVSESRPLIASFTPTFSSPTISGNSSRASSSCGSKSSWVNGSIVGERADAAIDGMSSGSMRIARWAYEPISKLVPVLALVHVRVHVADDRVADLALAVLEDRHRPDVDHLVDRRRERDRRAGHPGDPRAPDAAGDDDRVGLDVALVRADAP